MSMNDPLASVLSQITNAIKVGKSEVVTKISSKLIKQTLEIMKNEGYLGDIEEIKDTKGDYYRISLIGKLNACGVIKPRFAVQRVNFEKYEQRYLPARGFGLLIISTNEGLLTHEQAKEKSIGGKLISYFY